MLFFHEIELSLSVEVIDTSQQENWPDVLRLRATLFDQSGVEHVCVSHVPASRLFELLCASDTRPASAPPSFPEISRQALVSRVKHRGDSRKLSWLRVSTQTSTSFHVHEKYLSWTMAIGRVERKMVISTSASWEIELLDAQPDVQSIEVSKGGRKFSVGGQDLSGFLPLRRQFDLNTLLWRDECRMWRRDGRDFCTPGIGVLMFTRTGVRGEPTPGVLFAEKPDWDAVFRPVEFEH